MERQPRWHPYSSLSSLGISLSFLLPARAEVRASPCPAFPNLLPFLLVMQLGSG